MEIVKYAARYHLSDILHVTELIEACGGQLVDVSEVLREAFAVLCPT